VPYRAMTVEAEVYEVVVGPIRRFGPPQVSKSTLYSNRPRVNVTPPAINRDACCLELTRERLAPSRSHVPPSTEYSQHFADLPYHVQRRNVSHAGAVCSIDLERYAWVLPLNGDLRPLTSSAGPNIVP
jgi:hypothetical protein